MNFTVYYSWSDYKTTIGEGYVNFTDDLGEDKLVWQNFSYSTSGVSGTAVSNYTLDSSEQSAFVESSRNIGVRSYSDATNSPNGNVTVTGIDYTWDLGKLHVEELFWYGCGHCFSLEEHVTSWVNKLPKDVEFSRVPAMFGKPWVIHAQLYYMGEVLGITEQSHGDIFKAIHINGKRLQRKSEQQEFFAAYGVSESDFEKAYNSFTVKSRLKQGDKRIRNYRVSGVPAIVVNGKYLVDASSAGGQHNIFKVVDYLLEKERNQ